MIPVTVITGFLGSGKTTLLCRLLGRADLADTAVIVNEFGETDLDHTLISASSENIVQLMNGCICCTIRQDLALELRNLFYLRALGDVPRFNRVLIETTGLADPVPIIHTLMANTELKKVYRMQSVVTLVDAMAGERTLDDQPISVRQVALADHLLITKADIAEQDAVDQLVTRLAGINPAVDSVSIDTADLSAWLDVNHYPVRQHSHIEDWLVEPVTRPGAHTHTAHSSDIVNFTLEIDRPLSLAQLVLFFQELVNYRPDDLLRVKGLVAVADRLSTPAVVHCIRDKVYPLVWLDQWPQNKGPNAAPVARRSKLIFITRDLGQAEVEKILREVCEL